jgi:regulatory protein
MKKKRTFKEAKLSIAGDCSLQEKCAYDLEQKMKRWELSSQEIATIIRYLEQENYLNEQRFCDSFVHDKLHYNKWGKKKIAQALRLKRIHSETIQHSLLKIEDETYNSIIRQVLEAKKRTIKAANDYEFKNKLLRFASSRGFEIEIVLHLLEQAKNHESD